jgi:hypothetical protein
MKQLVSLACAILLLVFFAFLGKPDIGFESVWAAIFTAILLVLGTGLSIWVIIKENTPEEIFALLAFPPLMLFYGLYFIGFPIVLDWKSWFGCVLVLLFIKIAAKSK